MAKKITQGYIQKLDPSELGKMSKSELRNLLKEARKIYDKKAEKLDKVRDRVFSPALRYMEQYYSDAGREPVTLMSQRKAQNEIIQIQGFLNAKTSNVSQARKVGTEQDMMIFGPSEKRPTIPAHRMTVEERTAFWDAYQEFLNQNKTADLQFSYKTIMQEIGQRIIAGRRKKKSSGKYIDYGSFPEIMAKLERGGDEAASSRGTSGVYSGKGLRKPARVHKPNLKVNNPDSPNKKKRRV